MQPWEEDDLEPESPVAVYVKLASYLANTILAAETATVPTSRVIGENQVVGRLAGGNIKGLTGAELRTIVAIDPGVSYVFGRSGTVVAETNDYTWAQLNKAISSIADITTKSHTLLTDIGTNTHAQIDTHIGSTSNPHSVTKSQVGLGNVPDTDATNPVNITQSSSYRFVTDVEKGVWNGKQAALVSGTSIKTVNSNSLLGSGDVAVQPTLVSGTNIKTINSTTLLGSGDIVVSGADEKVKYDAGDPTAGYVADKFAAGTGITLAEGTGGSENKLLITNDNPTPYSLPTAAAATLGGVKVGTRLSIDGSGVLSADVQSGGGDVIGPAANSADYIPQWNGANTKTLKDGLAVPAGGLAGLTALGGKQDALTFGIANTNKVQIDSADVADNDYAKFTTTGLEGRSYSEVLSDIGAEPAKGIDDNYVTDAEKIVIGDTSGTNSGDNATNSQYSGLLTSILGKKIYHGIESIGALSFNDTSHVLTIGTATNKYWYQGTSFTTAGAITCDIDSFATLTANTLYYIYFDDVSGTLKAGTTLWDVKTIVPVCFVFWNGTNGAIFREYHNYTRNLDWHTNAHSTIGTRYGSGLDKTNPTTTNDALLQIESGTIYDEDLPSTITQQTTMRGFYQVSSGVYTYADYSLPYLGTSGQPQFLRTSDFSLQNVGATDFVCMWVYATPDLSRPIWIVPTQNTAAYNTITPARNEQPPQLSGLNLTPEMKLLYKFIYKGDGNFQEFVDYRNVSSLPSGSIANTSAGVVSFIPYGNIASTTVQGAIQELDDEKEPLKGADDNYVTDAEKIVIGNTSGANSGDNATNSQYSGLASSKADISGTPVNNQIAIWTGSSAIEGDVDLTYDGTELKIQNGNIRISPNSAQTVDEFILKGRNINALPAPFFQPTTANTPIAFDIMPKGTATDFATNIIGVAWIDICSNDVQADSPNYEALRLQKFATGVCAINSAKGGSGSYRDLILQLQGGNVGIGSNMTPTAALHIKAGTTAASTAPIKLTSGNLMTNPEAGAIEFLTDDLYLTITTGAARKKILHESGVKTINGDSIVGSGNLTVTGTGSSLWTLMPGTPTRVGNTSFTVAEDVTAYVAKGMIIKWTESAAVKVAMVSIPSTYSAPDTTITIIGDTMASIDASSLKYCMLGAEMFQKNFAVAGTIGAVLDDVSSAYYATEPMRAIGADLQVGTAGTTNATTIDIDKATTTMFTTKPTLATTVASSPTPFTADSGTSLALGDRVRINIDAIQTTPAVDLYVQLYVFPTRYLYLS